MILPLLPRLPKPKRLIADDSSDAIERMWSRLRNGRRIATRCARPARDHLAARALTCVVVAWT